MTAPTQSLLQLMPEVIATLQAEGMSVNLVNKLELAMAEPATGGQGVTIPEAIRTMAQRIAADRFEHCTSDPIFTVQKRGLLTGLDLDYDAEIGWFSEGDQVMGEEAVALEAEYQDSGTVPNDYTRTGIQETWEHFATYVTPEAAQEFVSKKGDQYRVYVDSGCRNHEWKALRAFLLSIAGGAA